MHKIHPVLQDIWVNSINNILFLNNTSFDLAPEVMCRQNHGVSVDYFAAGVMAFECMFGRVNYFLL
jgi:hypothetical protein